MMLFRNVAKWTLVICTVALLMPFSVSLQCYQCRSDVDSNCYDLEGDEYLTECKEDDESLICRTITQLFYLANTKDRFRECGYKNNSVTSSIKNDLVNRVVITCVEDGCNVATSPYTLPTWLYLLLIARYAWLPILIRNA